jgi:hypothetical protein
VWAWLQGGARAAARARRGVGRAGGVAQGPRVPFMGRALKTLAAAPSWSPSLARHGHGAGPGWALAGLGAGPERTGLGGKGCNRPSWAAASKAAGDRAEETRGRRWTSETGAANGFGPKREKRKEIPFYFQKTFS